ncbi:hypothetical protein A4S06_07405 [Erysipelotrichaceae bacterium MTC7]|nr:hypothetical protein A4S06_07405 [Erysipelotrichaceae bacterium MTC7]
MKKLAVFDVDGTIIPKGKDRPSERVIHALKLLQKKGIKIAVASGRPPFFIKGGLDQYIPFDYYICVNGAYVTDNHFEKIYDKPLSLEDTESLIADFVKYDQAIMFQFTEGAYYYNGGKRIMKMIGDWIGRLDVLYDNRKEKNRHLESLPFGGVAQIDDDVLPVLKAKYPYLAFDAFAPNYFDIHYDGDSKAIGLKVVADNLGIGMHEVIAFGDNLNDLQMLEAAGTGVALGNAEPEVKDIADYITCDVQEDGVVEALHELGVL